MRPIDTARFATLTLLFVATAGCAQGRPAKSSDQAPAVAVVDVPEADSADDTGAESEVESSDEGADDVVAEIQDPEPEREDADEREKRRLVSGLRAADGTSGLSGASGGTILGVSAGGGHGGFARAVAPQVRPGAPTVQSGLDTTIVRRLVQQRLPAIRHCYQTELTSDPSFSSRILLRFVIAANGTVSATQLTKSSGRAGFDGCVEAVAKSLVFPKPKGGGAVIVNYPFAFQANP